MNKEKSGNWFVRHKVLTVILVIIVIIAIGGIAGGDNDAKKVGENSPSSDTSSNQKSDSASEKTKFAVNEVISFDNKEVTVTGVERNWNSNNQFIKPDSGKEFVKVQVTIKNNSGSNISYNTFDWKLKDSTGDIQTVDGAAFTIEGALNSGELAEGGTKSGFLVFQVPNGDTGLALQYEPGFWSGKKLEINL